jgi:chromosome segregation ATPase
MEDSLKQKDDELNSVLDGERSRATAANMEKKEWSDLRMNLENQLADAQNLNESLQSELDRIRSTQSQQANTERELRAQIEDLRSKGTGSRGMGGNSDLERENDDLRTELDRQQRVTEEVRMEAQKFLREMRVLSERSGQSYEREEQLSNTVNKLEEEVRDWRNR